MTAAVVWEQRAALLHRILLDLAAAELATHQGRDGRLWIGSRETVLRDLWPDAHGEGRAHPYGGTLSRKLAGAVVKVGQQDGETVWWIASDRSDIVPDPLRCPTCRRRFASTQARKGHQASHRTGPRRLWADADVEALAERLAPRVVHLLADLSPGRTARNGDLP